MQRVKGLLTIVVVAILLVPAIALLSRELARAQGRDRANAVPPTRIDLATNAREMEKAAKESYEYYYAAYDAGTAVILDVYRWSYNWMSAGRVANKGTLAEIAAIEAHLERMQKLHARRKAQSEVGVNHPPCLSETRYWVLEAQRLLEESQRAQR